MGKRWTFGFGAMACFTVHATCLASGQPPVFSSLSSDSVFVDLNAGQTSFECTGTAFDRDPGDTIRFITNAPLFMKLDYVAGNPASFRLHAENLTGEQYGGYFAVVIAVDDPNPTGYATRFAISIVPEPASALALLCLRVLTRRSR